MQLYSKQMNNKKNEYDKSASNKNNCLKKKSYIDDL